MGVLFDYLKSLVLSPAGMVVATLIVTEFVNSKVFDRFGVRDTSNTLVKAVCWTVAAVLALVQMHAKGMAFTYDTFMAAQGPLSATLLAGLGAQLLHDKTIA